MDSFRERGLISCLHHLIIKVFCTINMHRVIETGISDTFLLCLVPFFCVFDFLLEFFKLVLKLIVILEIRRKSTYPRLIEHTWALGWEEHSLSPALLPCCSQIFGWTGWALSAFFLQSAVLHWLWMLQEVSFPFHFEILEDFQLLLLALLKPWVLFSF